MKRVAVLVTAAVLICLGCDKRETSSSTEGGRGGTRVVKLDGSSTVFPIAEAVAEEFQKAKKGTQVTVGTSGTGGGFKKFVRGEIDISNASRPILKKEVDEAKSAGIQF